MADSETSENEVAADEEVLIDEETLVRARGAVERMVQYSRRE